jgi:hypothetical protein
MPSLPVDAFHHLEPGIGLTSKLAQINSDITKVDGRSKKRDLTDVAPADLGIILDRQQKSTPTAAET